MAFRFDFLGSEDGKQEAVIQERKHVTITHPDVHDGSEPLTGQIDSAFVSSAIIPVNVAKQHFQFEGGVEVKMINGGQVAEADAVASQTDVLPGLYEGGFKIWECSFDAIKYMSMFEQPARMLDLGCGSGIVGIWALQRWSTTEVTFHDLNSSVLEYTTIPNVKLNGLNHTDRCTFLHGPWKHSRDLLSVHGPFDLITSADTLYDPAAINDLHDLCVALLRPGGQAIIAAKRFYFGLGGGVAAFLSVVSKMGKSTAKVIASYEDGASNIRDVISLRLN